MANRIKLTKVVRDLGVSKVWLYALYQAGLRSGHYRRVTPNRRDVFDTTPGLPPIAHFPHVSQSNSDLVLAEADEIRRGMMRLFGGPPVPLDLAAGRSTVHWTFLERKPPEDDIKLIWEPARFGWGITLARAYAFSGNPVYTRDFWEKTLEFISSHPPYTGRQWQSAQEVAIRLMVWVFCDRVLASAPSTTLENRRELWQAIAEHATRIPPTLVYARAQNNNHLLAEAAGLYSAGVYLPGHPQAEKWRRLGWHLLNRGIQQQVTEFGTYMQHSTNYHRLMLQLALFTDHLRRESKDRDWPQATLDRLAAATSWLWALTDPEVGRVPNLGAHDGAYIFPLSSQPIGDFRPTVSAAAKAFLDQDIYPDTDLQEMGNWFKLTAPAPKEFNQPQAPDMLRVASGAGRAFLRAAHFNDRPSHADQLHVDLWWRGVNIAMDPGSYRYTATPPWDNALQASQVHNTLAVDGREQMTRAGRFLWLDWAQAEILAHSLDDEGRLEWVTAEHNGYHKAGVRHQRKLAKRAGGWLVSDRVLPAGKQGLAVHEIRLSWLLPDWDWSFGSLNDLSLTHPEFKLTLRIEGASHINLVRAGETIFGNIQAEPHWGWFSPTYTVKEPALQLIAIRSGALPIELTSSWQFAD